MTILLFDEQVPWAGNPYIKIGSYVFLAIMALLVLIFLLERFLLFRSAVRTSRKFAPRAAAALKEKRWDEALDIARKQPKSHLARVVCVGLETRKRLLDKLPNELIVKHMEEGMEREIIKVNYEYVQGLARFEWIGGVAPFVGILGGSQQSFAAGTAIAVPALWFASFMRAKTLRFEAEMKHAASEVVTFVEEQMHSV